MNAYIVQGTGESTGCRLMTEILIKCGAKGSSEHSQEFQNYINKPSQFKEWLKAKQYNNLVCRFSFPHGNTIVDLSGMYNVMRSVYDKVYIVITTRSWICQEIGTDAGGHLKSNPMNAFPTVESRILGAYKRMCLNV